MLANPPKDTGLSPAGSGALYYFPEIPCSAGKDPNTACEPTQFVGANLDHHGDQSPSSGDPKDADQVQRQVEAAFDEGRRQGRDETITAHRDTINQAAAALQSSLDALTRIRRQDLESMEKETVRLALNIAKKVIRHETEHGPIVAQVVKAAMAKVTDSRGLTLKLNPLDVETVAACQQELAMGDDACTDLHLEADEAIQRGGCIIETQLGDVDARIDRQIKIIEELLIDQLPKPVVDG